MFELQKINKRQNYLKGRYINLQIIAIGRFTEKITMID